MFDSQTMQAFNGPNSKANKVQQIKADHADANDTHSNMLDYSRSSSNRTADIRPSQVLTNKICNKFSDFFRNWMF